MHYLNVFIQSFIDLSFLEIPDCVLDEYHKWWYRSWHMRHNFSSPSWLGFEPTRCYPNSVGVEGPSQIRCCCYFQFCCRDTWITETSDFCYYVTHISTSSWLCSSEFCFSTTCLWWDFCLLSLENCLILLSFMNTSGMDFLPWLLCSELEREPADTLHQLNQPAKYGTSSSD